MKQKGFTVVESLVAISILVVSIAGATRAIQTGISSYIFSKDQIVAFYLAQEGFEQIRNLRDQNRIRGLDWLHSFSFLPTDPCYFGKACIVDPAVSPTPTSCPAIGNCPKLRKDPSSGFYGYNGSWPETIFTREITLRSINSNEISVQVKVNWSKGAVNREFKAKANILKW